ncbi:MAG: heme-binding protein [Nitrospira sp.]|nr:heme-binding protein [Nitrospira sp.]
MPAPRMVSMRSVPHRRLVRPSDICLACRCSGRCPVAERRVQQQHTDGYRVSVSVVDRAGVLRAMGRSDGAGSHTVDSSRKKAYTAASVRRTTTELADLTMKVPTLQALGNINNEMLILGGGLPIEIGGEIVGGIGVSGAPGTHLDDACAQDGLDVIGAAPKVGTSK